jgi:hypothetical protein
VIERQVNGSRGSERLAAADLNTVLVAKYREQAVAHELVDPAFVERNSAATRCKKLVEQKHYVMRQLRLGKPREISQVENEYGKQLFDAAGTEFGLVDIFWACS